MTDGTHHFERVIGGESKPPITARFAPSPTGISHAGNIFTYLCTWLMAKGRGGEVVLRIEDLDSSRSKAEYADSVTRMLEETGLSYDRGPYFQSRNKESYEKAYELIEEQELVYPCFCTRKDLAFQSAPHASDNKHVYDRRCKSLSGPEIQERRDALAKEGREPSYRLTTDDRTLIVHDLIYGDRTYNLENDCGDFVVRRADSDFAYNLAVVVDDIEEEIDLVSRGCDLMDCTPMQIYLYQLLDSKVPQYAHLPLICAKDGRRLAKRDEDATYDALKKIHGSPEAVIGHIAYIAGLQEFDEPATPRELLAKYEPGMLERLYKDRDKIAFSDSAILDQKRMGVPEKRIMRQ